MPRCSRQGAYRGMVRRGPPGLAGFVVGEGGADLFDVGAVDADGFVELCAGDAKLFRPVGDVGRHLRIDLFGVVGACVSFGVLGVGGAELRLLDFFVFVRARLIGVRHWFVPLSGFPRLDAESDEGTPWAVPSDERRSILWAISRGTRLRGAVRCGPQVRVYEVATCVVVRASVTSG
jgi:hypothetical protein